MIGLIWGTGGIALVLIFGAYKLFGIFLTTLEQPLQWHHWLFLVAFTAGMIFGKAYKGFQQNISPRIAARSKFLYENPTPLRVLLAPFFSFGFFHAERKMMIKLYVLTAIMVSFVIMMKHVPFPWRGLIDLGVAIGLFWGGITILYFTKEALSNPDYPISPALPGSGA